MGVGTMAEWVQGIGTLLAFGAVAWQINSERLRRIKEEVQMQAQQVAAWVHEEPGKGAPKTSFAVANGSRVPIYRAIVTLVDVKGEQPSDGEQSPPQARSYLSVVPPGTWYVAGFTHRGMSFHPGVEIAFCDSDGRNWLRTGDGELQQIPTSPVEHYGLGLPLSWQLPASEPTFE